MKSTHLVIAVTGASGALWAKLLFQRLVEIEDQWEKCSVVFSRNAREIWDFELKGEKLPVGNFQFYDYKNLYAPFSSGSSEYQAMIICPCSMGTLGRIAGGISDDLITRAADVMLKEKRTLILVPRESPYNLIHLRNMCSLVESGATIVPASPGFYHQPENIERLLIPTIDRILQLCGLNPDAYRWQGK